MKQAIIVVAVAISVAISPASARGADRVDLTSGEVLYGKILKLNDAEVSIQLGNGGVLTFKRAHIRSVRREGQDDEPEAESEEPEPPARPATKPQTPPVRPAVNRAPPAHVAAPAAGSTPLPGEKGEALATLEKERVAFSVPPGFELDAETKAPDVLARYLDGPAKALLTLTLQTTGDAVEEAKKLAVHAYGKTFSSFSVVRNERVKKGDSDAKPEAWIVECDAEANGERVRQVQLFTKREDELFVLTYSAPASSHDSRREHVARTMASFRFLEATGEPR